jgi:hypothetical protein
MSHGEMDMEAVYTEREFVGEALTCKIYEKWGYLQGQGWSGITILEKPS